VQYYSCYGVLTYNNTLIEGSKRNYVKQTPPRRRASFLYINSSKLTCETSQPSVSSIDRFLVSPYIRSPRFILLAGKDSTRFDEVDCFFHSRKKRCALFFFPLFLFFSGHSSVSCSVLESWFLGGTQLLLGPGWARGGGGAMAVGVASGGAAGATSAFRRTLGGRPGLRVAYGLVGGSQGPGV
jgi:hypothetical protein